MRTSNRFLLRISISNRRHRFSLFFIVAENCASHHMAFVTDLQHAFFGWHRPGCARGQKKSRKHYGKKVKPRSNLCTLMDVNFSLVNKRDPAIRSRLPPNRHILDCIVRPFRVFLAPAFRSPRRSSAERNSNFMQMPSSEKNEKFLHSELWYLFMATSNTIISFMKSVLTIMGISFSSSFVSSVYGFLMNFVLTFSSGMFLFIAVVSGGWRRNRQVSYVRRRGEARRRRRSGRPGDSRAGTAHPPTAAAHHPR